MHSFCLLASMELILIYQTAAYCICILMIIEEIYFEENYNY